MRKKKNVWIAFVLIVMIVLLFFVMPILLGVNYDIIYVRNQGIFEVIHILIDALLTISVFIAYRQYKNEHEKARREDSLKLCEYWTKSLKMTSNVVRIVVESLSTQEAIELYRGETVKISLANFKMLKILFESYKSTKFTKGQKKRIKQIKQKYGAIKDSGYEDFSKIKLTRSQTELLRFEAIKYLNTIETVLCSIKYGISDDEILEDQFGFLLVQDEGRTILQEFRKAAGGDVSYPGIQHFIYLITEKRKNDNLKKKQM